MKNLQELIMLEYHLVDSCNLKCAGCSHYASLLDKLTYPSVDFIVNDFILLKSKIGDKLKNLRLLGGEPLIHPEICRCLKEIRNIFQHTNISIVTNGILLENMQPEFYDICRDNNIRIVITNYDVINVKTVINKLKEYHISVVCNKHSKLWRYKHIRLTEDKIDCFSKCKFKTICNNYRNGKIYLCPHIAYVEYFNKYFKKNIILDETDYISLNNIESFDDLIEKIHSAKPNFCYHYCNYYDKKHPEKGIWKTTKKDINEFCLV